jgi:fucokinase
VLDWRTALLEEIAAGRVFDDIASCGDDEFRDLFVTLPPASRERVLDELRASVDRQPEVLARARLLALLARFGAEDQSSGQARRSDRAALEDRAIAAVRESIVSAPGERPSRPSGVTPGARATVRMPVRIDFGGGWTDTPPFSLERGGAVVNAALTFGGRLPIEASVEALAEPRLLIRDDDLGYETEIRDPAELHGLGNVFDPFLLQKASLVLTGVLAPTDEPIDRQLWRLGGGLRLRTASRLPRGSGLGASSIVGAALLRALDEITGQPVDDSGLSRQTLALEQLMTTGGGWQDQMGAIAPGLKLITTEPGIRQSPRVVPVGWTAEQTGDFDAHLIVGYTGHHRVARNILREVVLAYLGRDAVAMQALYQLRSLAPRIYQAAVRFDLELLGTLVNQAWLLNKSLDPHTSYPALERLFRAFAPHVHGVKLVGAGGGGFFFAIGKTPDSRRAVTELLARDREFARGYLVEAALSGGGRLVTA